MNRTKFSEKQIHFTLKQVEVGGNIQDVCKIMGISQATFYNWRNKYSPKKVESQKKVRMLEMENKRLMTRIRELEQDKNILLNELKKNR
ncbi:transposase [Pantoea sp. B65]|uniref:transposase n=1 Tax=Pantoea sp. B65 TaxID=2813359 RepID=UPI0039B6657D